MTFADIQRQSDELEAARRHEARQRARFAIEAAQLRVLIALRMVEATIEGARQAQREAIIRALPPVRIRA